MKKFLSMMALAAMTACALVSCGSDDDDSPKGPDAPETLEPQTVTVKNNGKKVSFKMMPVEAGKFTMGDESGIGEEDERPTHSVTLTKSYYIGETEVTQALWKAVMDYNPSNSIGDNLPVEYVSWDECQEFITKLNMLTEKNFRLPTEAEWEFAARGGNKSKGYMYSGSNNLDDVAWYYDNSDRETHPVKTKAANELGIYDMSGNVWEWCQDRYGDYSSRSQTNPKGPSSGEARVNRGGEFFSPTYCCRPTNRDKDLPSTTYTSLGFRLAL